MDSAIPPSSSKLRGNISDIIIAKAFHNFLFSAHGQDTISAKSMLLHTIVAERGHSLQVRRLRQLQDMHVRALKIRLCLKHIEP